MSSKSPKLRERMLADMQLHGYLERTQEAYLRAVRQLTEFYQIPPGRITEEQVREYFLHRRNASGWAPRTLRIAYSGIKFFFSRTIPRDWNLLDLIRAQHTESLPVVLTKEEVHLILDSFKRPNYRAFFATLYGLGLRLEEGLNLKVPDIDAKRMLVRVHRGKGAKDRYVPLPMPTLLILRDYSYLALPSPRQWTQGRAYRDRADAQRDRSGRPATPGQKTPGHPKESLAAHLSPQLCNPSD